MNRLPLRGEGVWYGWHKGLVSLAGHDGVAFLVMVMELGAGWAILNRSVFSRLLQCYTAEKTGVSGCVERTDLLVSGCLKPVKHNCDFLSFFLIFFYVFQLVDRLLFGHLFPDLQ